MIAVACRWGRVWQQAARKHCIGQRKLKRNAHPKASSGGPPALCALHWQCLFGFVGSGFVSESLDGVYLSDAVVDDVAHLAWLKWLCP